ncbi:ATP-grasp domain-containing protein [Hydrogenimonas urashimensis]|uniref:ATP-grasp domain-containing protein n=1 Tax=Hydrogenimonas urashimensis TaxID=2740515 RepID=UPI00191687E3|nr:ATP-grasp domain-containing protein [Hydrogenimonas urashimensis]
MSGRRVGIWMYQNGGGDVIEEKIVAKLKERGIEAVTGLNLRHAYVENGRTLCPGKTGDIVVMEELDAFFSYNAGEQTQYQMFLYEAIDCIIPCLNNYRSFALTEDKFQTAHLLRNHGVPTADFRLCHRDDTERLRQFIAEWKQMVYKPTDGWGGVGLTKIDSQETLDMLMPFLNQMDLRFFYVEKFIDYDRTDYRVDIVDGDYIGCYGRKAGGSDWRTNITSGGSVFLREPDDAVVELALKAAEVTGLEIAGVDIIYDRTKEEYIVLEVNGIPAFATPEQEKLGLDFNDRKIEKIVDLIDRKSKKQ